MPELPEVETARRILESTLVGSTLDSVTVRLPKMFRLSPIPDPSVLVGSTLLAVGRRAKVLILPWSNHLTMLIHLKLSGQISVHSSTQHATAGHPYPDPQGPYPHRTTHVSLEMDNGWILHISDLRQFGWIQIMPDADVPAFFAKQDFGPEANAIQDIDPARLLAMFSRRSVPIKTVLLDQRVLAGIGNIYVDEALHRAKIHPATPANMMQQGQLASLLNAIQWAIGTGIKIGGAKIVNNKAVPVDGFPEVHARQGLPCPVCGTLVEKTRVGQRGTYFCPTCQPLPPDGTVTV
ncbi:MAG TPA: DNA-formamidopyrimidine glycosylase family protein [Thermomicrobiales bacterium]|nr:DNA-formamidopyrimidine glycosylase family protein [Thermomicrobiales bacterium]